MVAAPHESHAGPHDAASGNQLPDECRLGRDSGTFGAELYDRVAMLMAGLRERGRLVEPAARLLAESASNKAYDSHWRIFSRWALNRGINPCVFSVGTMAEFAADHIDEGFEASYTINIMRSVKRLFELGLNRELSSPVFKQLFKAISKRVSRFPTNDITEIPEEWELNYVAKLVDPVIERHDGNASLEVLSPGELRDRAIGLLRFYFPLRSSDVARIWRPSLKFDSLDGQRRARFRILFRKCQHKISDNFEVRCICGYPVNPILHAECLCCILFAYKKLTDEGAICQHVYMGAGDPCHGLLCSEASFLFLSIHRRKEGNGRKYFCLSADRVAAITKDCMRSAGFDIQRFKPHAMRALAARRLINLQGELVARTRGGWSANSNTLRRHYVPRTYAVIPNTFREQLLEEVAGDARAAD